MQHYLFMEALLRRIRDDDVQLPQFQEEFYRLQAGLAGETKLQQCLADYPFEHDYALIHNFECINERSFPHQIDALVLTAHFILVLEVKHLTGRLSYQAATHEFSRQLEDGNIENLTNPFDQVFRHKLLIERFLRKQAIPLPVHQLVVITNYRARLDQSLSSMPILHVSGLPSYIENLFTHYPSTNYSPYALQKLLEKIAQPLPPRRSIASTRLKAGVFCTKCQTKTPMSFYYGKWRCLHCQFESKEIVWQALQDYRILISPYITSKAFRTFTGIESCYAAARILAQLPLQSAGQKKGRVYTIPAQIPNETLSRK